MLESGNMYPNQLRVLRKQHLLSQKQLATLVGQADRTMISKYEAGVAIPPTAIALKLQIIFQNDVSAIFDEYYRQLEIEVVRTRMEQAQQVPLPINFIK